MKAWEEVASNTVAGCGTEPVAGVILTDFFRSRLVFKRRPELL